MIAVDLGKLIPPETHETRLAAWRLIATMSPAEFELTLREAGLWDGITAMVAALPAGHPFEILWRRISVAQRASPLWDQLKADADITDAQIDAFPLWTPERPAP